MLPITPLVSIDPNCGGDAAGLRALRGAIEGFVLRTCYIALEHSGVFVFAGILGRPKRTPGGSRGDPTASEVRKSERAGGTDLQRG